MSEEFKKGISVGLVIYLVAAVLTMVTHMIVGWEYVHAPPASFVVILLALLVGAIRFFVCLWRITADNNKSGAKGEMLIHAGVFALFFIAFLFISG